MRQFTILALLLPLGLFSQTNVSGEVSGHWTRLMHPITLVENVWISADDTLFIENGVEIVGDTSEIRIFGVLNATKILLEEGTGFFNDGGEILLDSCTIEGSQYGVKSYGGTAIITNTIVESVLNEGIDFHQVVFGKVENSEILDSGTYGIRITQSDSVVICHNILSGNSQNDTSHPALFIDSASPQEISYNHIFENQAQGIGVWALTGTAAPKLVYNYIQGNFTGITIVNATPILDHNTIIENFVEDEANSGAGLYIGYASALPILTNNYIANNYYGVSIVSNGQANLGNITNFSQDDDGYNVIMDNTFEETTWNIWNGTSHIIKAENNLWPGLDANTIDATLYDNDEGAFGVISFEPIAPLNLGKGNLDGDQRVSILDVVLILESILNDQVLYGTDFWAADISNDLEVDVNDLVLLIELVLNQGL